ncbi:MAG: MBL fold metallo-hydrolase [Candidatus Thorarchaeota archaeon]|nr:MBL fold metallo-hydrolase [Candidatus Thorarchaeota archaeon]
MRKQVLRTQISTETTLPIHSHCKKEVISRQSYHTASLHAIEMSDAYSPHIEIQPDVHLIRGMNNARFPEANCLLINDKQLTLLDAGASIENITATVRHIGRKITDITQIILTHFHVDHKGHAAEIQRISDCDIICHPLAQKGIETLDGTVEFYGIKGHRYYERWREMIAMRMPYVIADYRVTGHFKDGETITIGDTQLIPLHSPGHTEDHTIFGINGKEILMLVDIDLTRFGPWYGNLVSELSKFRESISKVIELEPSVGISSHLIDPVSENLDTRLKEYLKVFDTREQRIIKLVKEGKNTIELLSKVPTIYPRIPYDAYLIFEEYMLIKHIEDMAKRGIAEFDGERIKIV